MEMRSPIVRSQGRRLGEEIQDDAQALGRQRGRSLYTPLRLTTVCSND